MTQYQQLKKEYADAVLLFRLGDFYEMFGEDAKEASRILEIALTSRQNVPMCGVPHHSASGYIEKLIKQGKKVAICEQMESPEEAKGIVKREVVRVITRGTVLEENLLGDKSNNYLAAIFIEDKGFENIFRLSEEPVDASSYELNIGFSFVDVSTGEFMITQFRDRNTLSQLISELNRLPISEILLPRSYCITPEKGEMSRIPTPWGKIRRRVLENIDYFINRDKAVINYYDDWNFEPSQAQERLINHFRIANLKGIGGEEYPLATYSAGAIISYLEETQKSTLSHITRLKSYSPLNFMVLDEQTQRNLELVRNLREGTKEGSLLGILDNTNTAMGGRLFQSFILQPLLSIEKIYERQGFVKSLFDDSILRSKIRKLLKELSDIERLIGRLNLGSVNARDLINLRRSLQVIPKLKEIVNNITETPIKQMILQLDDLNDVVSLIESSIVDEPPLTIKEGGIIKLDYDPELRKLYQVANHGKEWIANLEEKERMRTGISSLKVGYTSVFGYYIEITKPNLHLVPDDYIRKQTLVNAERFVTPELKGKESMVLGAQEKQAEMEYQIFQRIRNEIAIDTKRIQSNAYILAQLDVFASLAEVAATNHYIMPKVSEGNRIFIRNGRHPVVEKMLESDKFVPNDTLLDSIESQIHIITGPNMAGKSTYIRQVALLVLMAQIGSFVPAEEAEICIVDRIFTRIGAGENIARGESTFMVEMNETANILNNATNKSLIILDEVGRGTSTFDGIGIAWACVEYLFNMRDENGCGPKTLFATHYFELTELAQAFTSIKNYNFLVREWNDQIILLRKLSEGAADKSYGIHVAKLAGLPKDVIERAKGILDDLERNSYRENGMPKLIKADEDSDQLYLFSESHSHPVLEDIKETDIDNTPPIEALKKIVEWKHKISEKGDST